jgi:hypothetical protein
VATRCAQIVRPIFAPKFCASCSAEIRMFLDDAC